MKSPYVPRGTLLDTTCIWTFNLALILEFKTLSYKFRLSKVGLYISFSWDIPTYLELVVSWVFPTCSIQKMAKTMVGSHYPSNDDGTGSSTTNNNLNNNNLNNNNLNKKSF